MKPDALAPAALTAVDYDPFASVALARVVPSTEAQREIWLASQLGVEASLAFNESVSLRLRGTLDRNALHAALGELIARHDALRASFGPDGETLCVSAQSELPLPLIDLQDLDEAARADALAERRRATVETAFELEQGPLMRAELLCLGSNEHVLLLTAHHIVCDGWSWWVMVRELSTLYGARTGLAAGTLPPVASFADYALDLARHGDDGTLAADQAWWLAQYVQLPAPLDLPTDHARPPRRSFASARIDHVLDAALVGEVKRLGAQRGASLFATLLGSFAAVLARLSGQQEVVVGIPAAAQSLDGQDHLVGHCVNLLPLRCVTDPAAPLAHLLEATQATLLDALDHQRYTFGTLLRKLDVPRDPSRLPLVSVLFNIDQALDQQVTAFPGLVLDFASNPRSFENFELFINAVQEQGHLRLECQYSRELFDGSTVTRWLEAFETLLRGAVARPDALLGALPIVGEAGRRHLLSLQPAATPIPTQSIHALFEAQCRRTPDRIAVRCDGQAMTYAALDARANRIAHLLRRNGARDDALVGIALDRSVDLLAAVLGALKTGAGYVPLDPGFPTERLSYMVGDASLAVLLTQTAHADRFDLRGRPVLALDQLGEELAALPAEALDEAGDSGDAVAYVIYTSGSTGQPKGVAIPHTAVVNFLTSMAQRPGLRADDRLVAVTTLSFDIAVLELLGPLGVGAEVVIARRENALDGEQLKQLLVAAQATVMQATPATWRMLLETSWSPPKAFRALCGGEALAPDLAEALLDRCGEVWNLYGPTETTVWSTCWRVERPGEGISIGTPIANTMVWILDEQRQLCPLGVPGEIWIGGAGVALGYRNRPELTADRFVADPFASQPDARLYRTGDRGRWRVDGMLMHLGRLDFQVKLRGFRIELGEIEARLLSLPGVADAVASTREFRPGDVRLLAHLVAAQRSVIDEAAVRAHMHQTLPDYMIPQHLIVLDALPRLPNGKINRARLRAPSERPGADEARTLPRDATEERVVAAMAAVLGHAPGVDDNFFEHGGHSLLAAQLVARLNRELGLALPMRMVFEAQTAARLAAVVRAAGTTGATSAADNGLRITHQSDRTRAPLSLMQQRLWYLEQLHPGRVVYNTPSAHRLRGPMDEAAFERALQEVVDRQAILRTSIEAEDGVPEQRIHEAMPVRLLPVETLTGDSLAEREAALMARLDALIAEPFELASEPLFRARLFRLGENDHVFFFMAHHIIWDGWSFDVLYTELSAAYAAFCAGQPMPLPPPAIDYGDFAGWQREWMQGEELERQVSHWCERLANLPEPLELPAARMRPPRPSGAGATEWIRLPAAQMEAVRALGQRTGATAFMVLLAAYYVFLHRNGGQRDLVVGVPVRGRERAELEAVMGFFVNALPMRVKIDPQASFLETVQQVRDVVLDSFAYPDVPFEHLVRRLRLPRDERRSPIYQASFSFQDVRHRNLSWAELQHEHLPVFQQGAAEDIGLWFIEQEHGLLGGLTYSTDLFDAEAAARLRNYYETLLDSALADPALPVSLLAFLPAAEIAQLEAWNATAAPIPGERLHGLFEAQATRTPERIAVRDANGALTYAELDALANRIAHALHACGVRSGALVGIALERGTGMVAALLGALKAGAGYVPLDPAFPAERLAFMIQDAGLAALVSDASSLSRLPRIDHPVLRLDAPGALDDLPATSLQTRVDPDAIAYVIYTSGSTGQPKGVEIPHEAAVNFLTSMAERPGLRAEDTLLAVTTLSFDIAVLELFGPLSVGGEVVLARREDAMDGETLKELLATHRCTVMQATPATWQVLLQAGWVAAPRFRALCGGEALTPELAAQLLVSCSEVWNLYGPTETTVWSTCWRVQDAQQGISIGTPIANTTVWILDEQGQRCPVGVSGEIWIGGAGVACGYHNRPELSAERFVPDPFASQPEARLYRTGDRGRWCADGTLEHQGRLDFQVKLRGFRIELGEIESIARQEPGVAECVAAVHEVDPLDRRLVLYVVASEAEDAVLPRVRAKLAEQLPSYMQPQHLVTLPALPRLPNGKTNRKALPAPPLHAGSTGDADEAAWLANADPRQRYLSALWCELIGVGQVQPNDNFFDTGGHSLLAMELAARVRRETGMRINLLDIATGTLASLAAGLPEGDGTASAEEPEAPVTLGGRLRRWAGLEPRAR
ncbi:amino acid adenylation domain-containing protein [Pseudoxanthomonas sp. GM95]|uniref:non-ribosomal peptide synthetase n=1 Tax=Pseudoxanthomonas sp. GM95 TaxID=1881043 RepID=UPI0008BF84B8|nr:non-ribosomal peptide synthetase [Pseudoxanthomonas sp. GM95]SEL09198.1 amino acid adenylation domain-containing protein [Pseudoxanthomonas sp. GM95]